MKKNVLLLLLLSSLTFYSCDFINKKEKKPVIGKTEATKYYEDITGTLDVFREFYYDYSWELLDENILEPSVTPKLLLIKCDETDGVLEAMGDFYEDDTLKIAAKEYVKQYRRMAKNEFKELYKETNAFKTSFKALDKEQAIIHADNVAALGKVVTDREVIEMDKFAFAQKAFATKYDIEGIRHW